MAEEDTKITDGPGFTAGETTLLITIMQNLTSKITFDADKVAEILGYKSGSIVKVRWGQIKRNKITGGGAAPAAIVKRTPKKKGKAASEGSDEVADSPIKTPAKRGRKPKAKTESADEGEGGEAGEKVKAEVGDDNEI